MTRKMKNICLISFFSPIFIIFLYMFFYNVFPLGTNSFIYWDTGFEYVSFFEYMKSLLADNNIFYSFSRFGGSDMIMFSSYYGYFSPFSIIFLITPDEYLNKVLVLMMLLKVGLCGLTFSYFLNKEFKESYFSVLFALSYALSTYCLVSLMTNYFLLDGIILFPLLMLGVEKIIKNSDSKLYCIILLLSILANSYMGFVFILCSIIYLIYKIFLLKNDSLNIFNENLKKILLNILCVVLLMAWLLFPILFSYNADLNYKTGNFLESVYQIRDFNLLYSFTSFLTLVLNTDRFYDDIRPYLFIGIIPMLLVILYFINPKIPFNERIFSGMLIIFLFLIFCFQALFSLFSAGVVEPSGTIYRFCLIHVFVFLVFAYKSFLNISDLSFKHILSVIGALIALNIILYIKADKIFDYIDVKSSLYKMDVIFALIFLASLLAKNSYKFLILFVILHLFNLLCSSTFLFSSQTGCLANKEADTFISYIRDYKQVLSYLRILDDGFYRVESQDFFIDDSKLSYINNTPMLLGYNGISNYSTFGNISIVDFYNNIGFVTLNVKEMSVAYKNGLQLFPLFFTGVKYIISKEELPYPYQKLKSIDAKIGEKISIYQNPYSLPIAFVIDDKLSYSDLKLLEKKAKNGTIYDYQNLLAKFLAGKDYGDIYETVDVSKDISSEISKKEIQIEQKEKELRKNKGYNEGDVVSLLRDKDTPEFNPTTRSFFISYNDVQISKISLKLPVPFDKRVYLGLQNTGYEDFVFYKILTGTTDFPIIYSSKNQNIYFENNTDAEEMDFDIYYLSKTDYSEYTDFKSGKQKVFFVYEDLDVLQKYYEELSQNPCQLRKISSSHLTGSFNEIEKSKLLFLSIPFDNNWIIKINGRKRKPIELLDSMMAIPVEPGDTELDMKYIPKGFRFGTIVSIVTLLVLLYRRKKRNS